MLLFFGLACWASGVFGNRADRGWMARFLILALIAFGGLWIGADCRTGIRYMRGNIFTLFVNKPDLIYMVAQFFLLAFFLLQGWKKKLRYCWPLSVLGLFWFVYSLWEAYCTHIKADIRVDLLFLVPFSLIATGILLVIQIFLLGLSSLNKKEKGKL
jgi:hypothetical protein